MGLAPDFAIFLKSVFNPMAASAGISSNFSAPEVCLWHPFVYSRRQQP